MTTTQVSGPPRPSLMAQVTNQREQLELAFHLEQGAIEYARGAQQHNPTQRQLQTAGLLVLSPTSVAVTDRGWRMVRQFAELDAYDEYDRREAAAAEPTEVFAAVPAEVEQTGFMPAEGTLPGRHRIVRRSRLGWIRARLTVARAAALSASVGVLVGIGFMWLVTR